MIIGIGGIGGKDEKGIGGQDIFVSKLNLIGSWKNKIKIVINLNVIFYPLHNTY